MSQSSSSRVSGFEVRWVVLSALGLVVGIAAGLGLAGQIEALVGMVLVTPVMLALAGSLFGASQWLAVWRWHRAGVRWVAASAAALGVGMTLGVVLVEVVGRAITGEQMRLVGGGPAGRVLSLAVIGTLTGLAVGATQRIALRPYGGAPAGWTGRCTAAFGAGLPAGGLAADLLIGGLGSPAGFATFLGVTGLVVGLATAQAAKRAVDGLPLHKAG